MTATVQPLNPTDILRNLHCEDALVLRQETKGFDTKIWKVMVSEGYAALRVFRAEQSEQFKFELQAMNLASAAGIPVPEVYRTGLYRSRPCMLLEWVDGETMFDCCVSPEAITKLGRKLGRMHRRLHADTMRQDGTSLLHMDYHPFNVIVDDEKIVAVIDWTNSEWGDPRRDVARTVSLFVCTCLVDRSDRVFARTLRRLTRAYLEGYGEVKGLKPFLRQTVADMEAELDYHIREKGLPEPKNARRILAKWLAFNQD